jgi:hypothetical protein
VNAPRVNCRVKGNASINAKSSVRFGKIHQLHLQTWGIEKIHPISSSERIGRWQIIFSSVRAIKFDERK